MPSQSRASTSWASAAVASLAATRPGEARDKLLAGTFSICVLAAVAWPVAQNWRDEPRDDFPLSFYPMFSAARGECTTLTHLVGFDELGRPHLVPCRYAGVGGMNQVRKQLRRLVRAGQAERVCRQAAGRLGRGRPQSLAGIVRVAVVTGTYRLDDFVRGKKAPLVLQIEAECSLKPAQAAGSP